MKNSLKKYIVLVAIIIFSLFVYKLPVSNDSNLKNEQVVIAEKEELTTDTNSEINKETNSKNSIITLRNNYQNNDIIAILKIENTDLESIVVKTTDNDYYLTHNLKKETSKIGTTFMDYRNLSTDRKILIYGHNSKTLKTEFHILENFLDNSFYRNHSKIILEMENETYEYQIFSILVVTTDYQHMKLNFTDEEWHNHLSYLKENSVYDTNTEVLDTDDIIILQTCYYQPDNSYILLAGKKIKTVRD